MTTQLITVDTSVVAKLGTIDALNKHITSVLARHEDTKDITLEYSDTESNSLSQVMRRNWEKRPDMQGDKNKTKRTNEMRALKAVFIAEGINDLIEAWFHYNGYQRRFTGTSKVTAKGTGGIGGMQFVPPASQGDKVGTQAKELESSVKTGRVEAALKALLGDKAGRIVELKNGDVTVEDLMESIKE